MTAAAPRPSPERGRAMVRGAAMALADGHPRRALDLLAPLLELIDGSRSQVGDTFAEDDWARAAVTASWAAVMTGDGTVGLTRATRALATATAIDNPELLVAATTAAAACVADQGGPVAARGLVAETRWRLTGRSARVAGAEGAVATLDIAEAAIVQRAGDLGAASDLVRAHLDRRDGRIRRASISLAQRRPHQVERLLPVTDVDSWPDGERIEARFVVALARDDRRGAHSVLAEGASLGLVFTFLRHGSNVDHRLNRMPLDRLHPDLARALRGPPVVRPAPVDASFVPAAKLSGRERTVLELLPTHLTYDQMGERLAVSVNTVKTSLKSVYRKLAVGTRSDAVDAARAAGLL